jgi:hypothetical protein
VITALHDTDEISDMAQWVDEFEISHPVGGDYDDAVWDAYTETYGRPQFAVIDRDFDLVYVDRDLDGAEQAVMDAL